ncbi:MAG: hypothetical protein KAX18_00380 [Candidatus Lokiarchaeota archaeon]|nr:hypothetical protein [Candidatus Lokiarchaeota archaeon]
MKDLREIPEFSKYFRVISPAKIEVNKEKIFYRYKYDEIINYIKVMATYNGENTIEEYLSPKGAVLINVNPGTDILDFLKLISTNYYLELVEFNYNEIRKAPESFLKSFTPILRAFGVHSKSETDFKSDREDIDQNIIDSDKNIEKRILIINQQLNLKTLLKGKNLLEIFFTEQNEEKFNFLESNIILMWINYNIQDILENASSIYDSFDLFIRIQLLNKIERETVFRDFLEKNPKIVFDINALVDSTDKWEIKDIKQVLKVGIFKHFLNSELNDTSNEITQILLDLIESGEYLPTIISNNLQNQQISAESEIKLLDPDKISKKEVVSDNKIEQIDNYINNIRDSRISDFMLNQLYEDAAFKNYREIILIIDKLEKNEPLEKNDRKLLADYPFILNDPPNKALINLEKAKKRVDSIKQAFGK